MKDIYLVYTIVISGFLLALIMILMIIFFQNGHRLLGFALIIVIIINLFILGLLTFILETLIPRKYPNYEDPDEIKMLKVFLEGEDVR